MSEILDANELKAKASLVELLTKLGFQPVPRRGRELMYISMLRDNDRQPSFSVNDQLGVWYDHGLGKVGNIIDFAKLFWKGLEFPEVLGRIRETLALEASQPIENVIPKRKRSAVKVAHYDVEHIKRIGTHPAITEYLKGRGIFDQAKQCLSEIYYYVDDRDGKRKRYFAAGWKNDQHNWEVRNKFFKGCFGKKSITTIVGDEKKVALFEGFLDYLSWRKEHPDASDTVIVLNSVNLLASAIAKSKRFSSIDLYFDRDKAGLKATKEFIVALPYATDRSKAYEHYNDYNDKIRALLKGPVLSEPDERALSVTELSR